jgi:hypothetical protein
MAPLGRAKAPRAVSARKAVAAVSLAVVSSICFSLLVQRGQPCGGRRTAPPQAFELDEHLVPSLGARYDLSWTLQSSRAIVARFNPRRCSS